MFPQLCDFSGIIDHKEFIRFLNIERGQHIQLLNQFQHYTMCYQRDHYFTLLNMLHMNISWDTKENVTNNDRTRH